MAYITQEEFEEAFSQAELNNLIAEAQDFHTCAEAASSLIDGYVASKYTLPFLSVPTMIKGWALDITRYRLWSEKAPEEVRQRYEDALSQLRDVARGLIALPADAPASASGFAHDGYGNERVFTEDTLADF